MPAREELPETIRRSPRKAQETWSKAHDSAVRTYGEGRRAHQTAFAALKHSFEKVGDHWEPKRDKGPSDRQASRSRGQRPVRTAAGVDANASKQHLLDVARRLDVPGRSRMTKDELVRAIMRANRRSTRAAERGTRTNQRGTRATQRGTRATQRGTRATQRGTRGNQRGPRAGQPSGANQRTRTTQSTTRADQRTRTTQSTRANQRTRAAQRTTRTSRRGGSAASRTRRRA